MKQFTSIKSAGQALGKRTVDNHYLAPLLDTTPEWIEKRTGIQSRQWVDSTESTSDLAYQASVQALAAANWQAEEIDLILLATLTPDHEFPGTACFLQAKLGIKDIPVIDIRQQCSGFVYALDVADSFLLTHKAKKILLVCSEVHSKCLDLSPRGRNVSILFGDGAGAVTLELADRGLRSIITGADGSQAKKLWCPAPGTGLDHSLRIDASMVDDGLVFPHMDGRAIFTSAVRTMSETYLNLLSKCGISSDSVDLVFFHQANLRICEAISNQLELPAKKCYNTIQQYGNTTAATIPLSLSHAIQNKALVPGMRVAFVAFGSGYTWGGAILDY